jgi:hypothetical protein
VGADLLTPLLLQRNDSDSNPCRSPPSSATSTPSTGASCRGSSDSVGPRAAASGAAGRTGRRSPTWATALVGRGTRGLAQRPGPAGARPRLAGGDRGQAALARRPGDQGRLPVTRVVLASAHLDHDPSNNRPRNLAALCQRCHMLHDAVEHRRTRWRKRFNGGQRPICSSGTRFF